MTRDELIRQLSDRLFTQAVFEVPMDEAAGELLSHPRISRALTLLDRIGEDAADALIGGTAAVVPVEATKAMQKAWHDCDHDETPEGDWQVMVAAGRLDRGGA